MTNSELIDNIEDVTASIDSIIRVLNSCHKVLLNHDDDYLTIDDISWIIEKACGDLKGNFNTLEDIVSNLMA